MKFGWAWMLGASTLASLVQPALAGSADGQRSFAALSRAERFDGAFDAQGASPLPGMPGAFAGSAAGDGVAKPWRGAGGGAAFGAMRPGEDPFHRGGFDAENDFHRRIVKLPDAGFDHLIGGPDRDRFRDCRFDFDCGAGGHVGAVPEPSSAALALAGLGAVAMLAARRRAAARGAPKDAGSDARRARA